MAKSKIANKNQGSIFERHEKKYLLNKTTYNKLISLFKNHMEEDSYGLHTINTIYYDTNDYKIIRKSIDKPDYKEKLRLRSYGTPKAFDKVYLELKKKLHGVTYKRRITLALDECQNYLTNGTLPMETGQIFGEIDWFVKQNNVKPKVLISYDRVAMFGKDNSDFRITFDMNIRWRDDDLNLADGDNGNLLLDSDNLIMEIKTIGAFPIWLTEILTENDLFPTSFSKYGNIYKWYLLNEEVFKNVG